MRELGRVNRSVSVARLKRREFHSSPSAWLGAGFASPQSSRHLLQRSTGLLCERRRAPRQFGQGSTLLASETGWWFLNVLFSVEPRFSSKGRRVGGRREGLIVDDRGAHHFLVIHQEGRTAGREGVVRGSRLFFIRGGEGGEQEGRNLVRPSNRQCSRYQRGVRARRWPLRVWGLGCRV